jgi:hypothetical protein
VGKKIIKLTKFLSLKISRFQALSLTWIWSKYRKDTDRIDIIALWTTSERLNGQRCKGLQPPVSVQLAGRLRRMKGKRQSRH